MIKKFSKDLYLQNDLIAKKAVYTYLETNWHFPEWRDEDFGIDLISEAGRKVSWHEVSRTTGWKKESFQDSFPNDPGAPLLQPKERRDRTVRIKKEKAPDANLFFWIVNFDCNLAYCFTESVLVSSEVKPRNFFNNNFKDEPYYHIERSRAKLIDLTKFHGK